MALPIFQRTITDNQGNVLDGASVEVRIESDNSLAILYSDRDGLVALSNPFTTGADGLATFYTKSNEYKITATHATGTVVWRYQSVFKVPPVQFNTLSDLLSYGGGKFDGQQAQINNYHSDTEGGGGVFYWDATRDKALHNGGTIIDPDITFPTDWTNQTQLTTWFTAGTGSGCWVRQGFVNYNVRMFGAKLDGSTVDYLPIQQAHDTSASDGSILGFKDVLFDTGTVVIGDNTLAWSSNISAVSSGSIVLKFSNTTAKGIHISTEFGNWDTAPKQIAYNLKHVFSGSFVIENTLGSGANTAIGIFFGDDGVATYSAESLQLSGVNLTGWAKSHTYGSHAYIISWHKCRFYDNGSALFIATGNGVDTYIDSWEKISFKECIFAGNTNVIDGDAGAQGDYSFDNCSIDYNTRILASFTNTAIIQFGNGCHIEWDSETDTALNVLGVVSIIDSYLLWLNGTGTPPAVLLGGIGANGVLTLDNNTYTFPTGTSVVQLSDSTSKFYGEENPLYYGGSAPTYINNTGGGTIYRTIEVIAGSGRSVTDEHGNRRQSFTVPNTALLANENKTVTVTYPEPFDNVVEYAYLSCQPDASADFYGCTQVVQTGTPLSTVSFVIRNGASAQNAINIKGIAFGY